MLAPRPFVFFVGGAPSPDVFTLLKATSGFDPNQPRGADGRFTRVGGGKAARDSLFSMRPIRIPDDPTLMHADIAIAKIRAKAIYRSLEPTTTSVGARFSFPMSGFKETVQHAADRRVLLVIPCLGRLIRAAILLWSEASTKADKPNIKSFHHVGVKAAFPTGDAYVRIVLREDNDGHVYYDNDATSVELLDEKKAPYGARQPDRKPNPGEGAGGLSRNRLAQWLDEVNKDDAAER